MCSIGIFNMLLRAWGLRSLQAGSMGELRAYMGLQGGM